MCEYKFMKSSSLQCYKARNTFQSQPFEQDYDQEGVLLIAELNAKKALFHFCV